MVERVPDHELEVIREFDLTNREWLRYRLIAEFPDRANAKLAQRYKEQTCYLDDPFYLSNKKKAKLPAVNMQSFETATVGILHYTDKVLLAPEFGEDSLQGLVSSFADYTDQYGYWNYDDAKNSPLYHELEMRSESWIASLQEVMTIRPPKTKREQALVIAAFFNVERIIDRPYEAFLKGTDAYDQPEIFEGFINKAFREEDFELLGQLLTVEDGRLSTMVHGRVKAYYDRMVYGAWDHSKQIEAATTLLSPLVTDACMFVDTQEMIGNVEGRSRFVTNVCKDIKAGVSGIKALSEKGISPESLADDFFSTCINSLTQHPTQIVPHIGLEGLLTMLTALYSLGQGETRIPLRDIYPFLVQLYEKKVKGYTDFGRPIPEHQDFVNLAAILNLDMDIITGKDPLGVKNQ